MEMRFEFTLKKQARSTGGDRYECKWESEPKPWVVYFPQSISRERGIVKDKLTVTVSD